jgi:uncharacterized Fe-S center protein
MNVFYSKDLSKLIELFEAAEFGKIISQGDSVALKIHFGEPGNQAYLKPERVRALTRKVRDLGGLPFWTDANTLYRGQRGDDQAHLQTAHNHGYTMNRTGADVVISSGIPDAKAMIVITHFKGHELTGFGGALKNVGMGCATRAEKLDQHSACDNCKAKPSCKKKEKVEACWVGSSAVVQKKIVAHAAKAIRSFNKKTAFINFITDVSENCDCYPHNSTPIVPDLGVLASSDPVALDQACVDMVNNADGRINGRDKFKTLWPEVDWQVQLDEAEKLGLGSRKYELISL